MPFQPFGYRFDIRSHLAPPDVKAVIRARKKGWFDPKIGARGWIVGSFVCLWFNPFDAQGPMLIGRISSAGAGTRISGRAGSDLNGVIGFAVLLLPLMLVLLIKLGSAEGWGAIVPLAPVLVVLATLMFWVNHALRRDAEPLVRFVRDAVTKAGPPSQAKSRPSRPKSESAQVFERLKLNVSGDVQQGHATAGAIEAAFRGMEIEDFVILDGDPQHYIQTASRDDGYVIEMRAGDRSRHYRAVRQDATASSPDVFDIEEALEAFLAYAAGTAMPPFLKWEPMRLW